MSDLISIGRSGIRAYQGALAAVGQNVSNANTDGYAKRDVVLKEQTSGGVGYLSTTHADFNGVQQTQIVRAFDLYKSSAAWTANSDSSYANARSQYLTSVQTQLSDSDTGIGTKLTAIFTSANQLASNPTDTTLRQSMLYVLQDAAGSLGQAAANIDKVNGTIFDSASSQTSQLNTALQQLATLNLSLETAQDGTAGRASLEDQRDSLISTISGTIGVDVTLNAKGAATLKLSNYSGPALVTSTSSTASLVNLTRDNSGQLGITILSDGKLSAGSATSGSLAGLIDSSANAAGRRGQLNDLATQLATAINGWQKQGVDANGAVGGDLMSITGNDATTLKVTVTDTAKIAAARTTVDPVTNVSTTSANGNLLALSDLRKSDGVEASWHSIVTAQALQVSAATTAATTASAQKDGAYTALDSVSGVNLDDEAANLLRFQQAYAASSKIIQAAKDTFQTILGIF